MLKCFLVMSSAFTTNVYGRRSARIGKKRSGPPCSNAWSDPENIASQMFEFPHRFQVVLNASLRQRPLVTGKESFCFCFCVRRNNQALRMCVADSRFKISDFALKNLFYLFAKQLVLGAHLAPHA